MDVPTNIIDHIVHLSPPGSVEETAEQFRNLGFRVIPGGTHAGGLTANSLVVFGDGVYLELISFTHPVSSYPPGSPERRKREYSRWASELPGWIDYSFLGNGSDTDKISDVINNRSEDEGSGVVYLSEQSGGRTRPDGEVLKWIITAPDEKHGNGILPFFCGDVTPRKLRVPDDPPSNTHHPSSALGIAHIRVLTNAEGLTPISRQLTSVIGKPPISSTTTEVVWLLETVEKRRDVPLLILSTPKDSQEQAFTGPGIYEVAVRVEAGHQGGSVRTPYGKLLLVPNQ